MDHAGISYRAYLLTAAAVLSLAGCETAPRRDPAYAATLPAPVPQHRQNLNGAIYQPSTALVLFEDIKARRAGDLLTIRLIERTDASKSASTNASRDATNRIPNPTLLGTAPLFGLPAILPLAATSNNTLETEISANNSFSGKGDSKQSNSLRGDITVTVADVLPNGYLVVRGEKRLNLNQGNEYVQISGIVRPTDIASDNAVASTKVADTTIIYSQDGHIADTNKIAWLARFFVGALFPL